MTTDSTRASVRNFLAVWPSLFVTSVGVQAILPSLPLYIEDRFGIEDPELVRLWAGAVYGAAPLASAIAGPFWGALGDRYGRRLMALRAMWSIMIVTAVMPFAAAPIWLVMLRALQGALAGYIAPAMSLALDGVPAGRQGRTIGRLQLGLGLGLLAGPAIGAEIGVGIGREAVFWLASVLAFFAGLPILLFAREDRERLRTARSGRTRSVPGEILTLVMQRKFAALFLCILLVRCGQSMCEPYIALWVRELGALDFVVRTGGVEGAIDRTTALAFSIVAVAQILITTAWGRLADRAGPLRCLAALSGMLGVVLLLTSTATTIEGFLGYRSVAAIFMAGSMTLAYAAVGKHVPSDNRALAFACAQSCIQLGLAFGPMLGAFLSLRLGIEGVFASAGGLLVFAAVFVVWMRSRQIVAG